MTAPSLAHEFALEPRNYRPVTVELQIDGSQAYVQAICPKYALSDAMNEESNSSQFERLNFGNDFMEHNPKAATFLRARGFDYSRTFHEDDGSVVIDGTYTRVDASEATDMARALKYVAFEGSYTSQEFLTHLVRGEILISVDQGYYDIHDNLFHRPMWELVGTIPDLLTALQSKAQSVLEQSAVLESSDMPPSMTAAEQDLARLLAHNNLEDFMEQVDDEINISGNLAMGMNLVSDPDPAESQAAKSQIEYGLRQMFMSRKDYQSKSPDQPDANVSDEQISQWADSLLQYAGNKAA